MKWCAPSIRDPAMAFLDILEVEETVGRLWHRLVGENPSWPRFAEAAVPLDAVRGQLAVFFRGVGGDKALTLAAVSRRTSAHRLTWKQRLGMEAERLPAACRDDVSLSLPDLLDCLPTQALNRDLYFWLAAFFAEFQGPSAPQTDPLLADLDFLARVQQATQAVVQHLPGLADRHAQLCQALDGLRPVRRLSGVEAQVEAVVRALLQGRPPVWPQVIAAPLDYRPFLPCPLWGEAVQRPLSVRPDEAEPGEPGAENHQDQQDPRRQAERRRQDNTDRKDPIILNRFEKVLAMAEMVNVNRAADDSDEDEARKAADDLDTIVLSRHSRKAATKLKFDLDLPPEATDPSRLTGSLLYPEWDHRARCYHPDHCSVLTAMAGQEGEIWQPDDATKRRIRQVRRQFEALRTRPQIVRGQADGAEIDTDAAVRARADLIASGVGSDRIWTQRRKTERDLSVLVLVDSSLSTDAWIENRRVLDVEKEALAVFGHGLAACGDPFSILSFSSRKRSFVKIDTLKDFDEPFSDTVLRRIGAMKPGYYTRIGTAIRHAAAQLEKRPCRHRLLLVITDGKPNDVDHYEGRYGLEDSRVAVQDARAKGLSVYGITIDRKAQSYFPHLFGRGHYSIVHQLAQLSAALPRLYRHLVAQ